MDDASRILGKLEANHEHTTARLDRVESKVDAVLQWKWKIVGGALTISALVSGLFQLLMFFKKGA